MNFVCFNYEERIFRGTHISKSGWISNKWKSMSQIIKVCACLPKPMGCRLYQNCTKMPYL